jgi:hypothetical protein
MKNSFSRCSWGGAVREDPPHPIFGFVSEGDIPKGANILRFEEGFKKSCARDSIECWIPHYGVFLDSNCFPLPGIQVREEAKKLCAFKKMEKIDDP